MIDRTESQPLNTYNVAQLHYALYVVFSLYTLLPVSFQGRMLSSTCHRLAACMPQFSLSYSLVQILNYAFHILSNLPITRSPTTLISSKGHLPPYLTSADTRLFSLSPLSPHTAPRTARAQASTSSPLT